MKYVTENQKELKSKEMEIEDNNEEKEDEGEEGEEEIENGDEKADKIYQQTILMKQYNQVRTLCLKNITELITMLPKYI